MVIYADYQYYTEQFHGTAIAQADYRRLAQRAGAEIDQVTFNRAGPVVAEGVDTELIERIRSAVCAVAEELGLQEAGGEIQSERVGQHQVTYNVAAARSLQARISDAARVYLSLTGLMFRGVDADE